MEEKFNDMGIDALTGSEVMMRVGVSPSDLRSPQTFEKVKDIMQFMKTVPQGDRSYFLNKITAGKAVNKLDHVWGYVELSKKRSEAEKTLNQLKEEISFYER